ncbi:hypothetical protein [Pseudomonas putida]|uniref:hypothetical protein n=1 Tax=Pseudomonas putida TaxID=303 RepID=UPI0009538CE0|nr:hypothetical protein [Pseudomonas putida]SIR95861.1 hypothetical protein SAMN05216501_2919 [Pseudomonas putida]
MSKTLHGTTEVTVGGRVLILSPTLRAVRTIEAYFGGLRGASERLRAVGVDAVAVVFAAGSGMEEKGAVEELAEEIWQQGVADLVPAATAFLYALYNPRGGNPGKPPAPTGSAP